MQDFEKHKSNFFSFINRIQPQEKIAIIAHANCIDGMTSVVFLIEIVKKKYPSLPDPSIYFLPYKAGTLDNLEAPLKKNGITKVCILDLNADWNIPIEFEKFRETAIAVYGFNGSRGQKELTRKTALLKKEGVAVKNYRVVNFESALFTSL